MRRECMALIVLGLAVLGCDQGATTSAPVSGTSRPAGTSEHGNGTAAGNRVAVPPAAAPARTPLTFGSIDEALRVLAESAESGDPDSRTDATKYLIAQGQASISPIGDKLNQPDISPRTAIALCRTLGQLGPGSIKPLVAALAHKDTIIRVNATEQLAIIDPPTSEIVDQLISLVDDADGQVRLTAIRGLGHLGTKAGRSAERLQTLMNNVDESDTLRTAAGAALKKVNPRRTFAD